jgi:hypothetical protein
VRGYALRPISMSTFACLAIVTYNPGNTFLSVKDGKANPLLFFSVVQDAGVVVNGSGLEFPHRMSHVAAATLAQALTAKLTVEPHCSRTAL